MNRRRSLLQEGFESDLGERLAELERRGLRRTLRTFAPTAPTMVEQAGRHLVNFSSNDYLGLASEPRLREAAIEAMAVHGIGAGASRLVSGTFVPHEELESGLAAFKGTEAALAFSSGYAAATGAIPALLGKGDTVILDKLSHACLIDGARLSGATLRVFPHNHVDRLETMLRRIRAEGKGGRVLIVTESVFSMDGDAAPLRELVEIKERYGAMLLVDEAHAVGVLGPGGRGLIPELGLGDQVEIQMGTLGKALGSSGGYLAGSRTLIDYLIHHARSFIYSTAPPVPAVAAACEALRIVQSPEGDVLREALAARRHQLATRVPHGASRMASAIYPHRVGAEAAAVAESERLLAAGFLAPAIRYPTVARGAARLRVTLSARHAPEAVDALLDLLFSADS